MKLDISSITRDGAAGGSGDSERDGLARLDVNLPPLEVSLVAKKRAFLNSDGVLQLHEENVPVVDEVPVPPQPVGFWQVSSWCRFIKIRQQLKLRLPRGCNDFDEVPMMPCMSNNYVSHLEPPIRDRDKNWRLTSFRAFYVGRGNLARKKKPKKDSIRFDPTP